MYLDFKSVEHDLARQIELLQSIAERLSDKGDEEKSEYFADQVRKCLHQATLMVTALEQSPDHPEWQSLAVKLQRLISDLDALSYK